MFEPFERETITTAAGTFRVNYHRDDDPMSPREHDNLSVLVIDHEWVETDETPRVTLGSRVGPSPMSYVVHDVLHRVNREDVSTAAACRYLRALLGAWAVLPVVVGFDKYTPSVRTEDPTADRGERCHGFVFDTPERRAVMGPETPEQAETWLREDVAAFSRYTEGEYVGYVIERAVDPYGDLDPDDEDAMSGATWEHTDSCWSIDSLDYAREMATAEIQAYRPKHFPSPVLAVQV